MTIQEKACHLIGELPTDCVAAIVEVMKRMLPHQHLLWEDTDMEAISDLRQEQEEKVRRSMDAFRKMMEMRKENASRPIEAAETAREKVLAQKYGQFM